MISSRNSAEALIQNLGPLDRRVADAMRAVPRHLFVPPVALACPDDGDEHVIDREADPAAWWEAVYSDIPIVAQLDDGSTDIRAASGRHTSASSAPCIIARFLEWLNPEPGHRVLEIGTGTGWTAALLSHIVGAANVTSIEVDPVVAEQAAKNLGDAGFQPHLIVGDGAEGCPSRAPYDRVHVTCGVRTVPYTWVEQSRPGAVIAAPFMQDFQTNFALRLVVTPDGVAHGRFPGLASYMLMRAQRSLPGRQPHETENKRHLTTRIDPRTIAYAPIGADLAIGAMTGLTAHGSDEPDEDGELYRMWVTDPRNPDTWAVMDWRPGCEEYEVFQVGDRPVWEEVTDAYFRWVGWGEPDFDRFGMTVGPDGQRIWLDRPGHPLTGRLSGN
ncbi:methyltransferase domain-containing protein [Nonomuraea ferruginea]|uniref:Protein-L-isoaspartate O-methyltransferase n=1 Tax=Nonomuraea ferruginea TaxID=46174 RepID=A0ABT4SUM9_9ACTN|nr:methyltransferase domain-containing protein [Nonomuraea ferruginea]MDA0640962.1 methyltransferase domain-containing protein [Nonomuraea ferruginea]